MEWVLQVRLKMLDTLYCHLTLTTTYFIRLEVRVRKMFRKKGTKIAYLIKW